MVTVELLKCCWKPKLTSTSRILWVTFIDGSMHSSTLSVCSLEVCCVFQLGLTRILLGIWLECFVAKLVHGWLSQSWLHTRGGNQSHYILSEKQRAIHGLSLINFGSCLEFTWICRAGEWGIHLNHLAIIIIYVRTNNDFIQLILESIVRYAAYSWSHIKSSDNILHVFWYHHHFCTLRNNFIYS